MTKLETPMNHQKVFAWPSKELLVAFTRWFLIVFTAYAAVYYPCNSYAAKQMDYYHMYASWELSIPLIPQMIVVYLSYVAIFIVLLFVFKTPDAIKGLAYSMLVTVVVSGVIFIAFPGHLGYSRPDDVPGYSYLFRLVYSIDHPYNLFPSLHVSFAYLCVLTMIHQTQQRWFHLALKIWFAVVCTSVILVHQHHLFDIALAMILSWAVYKKVYLAVVEKQNEKGGIQSNSQQTIS